MTVCGVLKDLTLTNIFIADKSIPCFIVLRLVGFTTIRLIDLITKFEVLKVLTNANDNGNNSKEDYKANKHINSPIGYFNVKTLYNSYHLGSRGFSADFCF